jgi:hypothetical protein
MMHGVHQTLPGGWLILFTALAYAATLTAIVALTMARGCR